MCRGWIYYIQKESEGLKKNNGGGEKREGVTIIIIQNARPGKGEGSKIKAALRFKAGNRVRLVCGVAALAERASISGFLLDHPPSFLHKTIHLPRFGHITWTFKPHEVLPVEEYWWREIVGALHPQHPGDSIQRKETKK